MSGVVTTIMGPWCQAAGAWASADRTCRRAGHGHRTDLGWTDHHRPFGGGEQARGRGPVHALVNNAGGAIGLDPVATGSVEDWRAMYEVNVLRTLRVTQALLPDLRASGRGDVVVLTSTAGYDTYPGGGGYVAAKHAERSIAATLRLELVGEPVRVVEVAPGMVQTEEFSLNRFGGDQARADAVYAGVDGPLVAEDVADAIVWCLTRPQHVNIDSLVIRPRAQASNTPVSRKG